MKKTIFAVLIVGMFVWAVYDFVNKEKQTAPVDEKNTEVVEEKEDKSSSEEEAPVNAEENNEKKTTMFDVGLNKGNLAPDFELETLDGEVVALSDFRGKRVMLNFWATWCPPCRAEMPDMQKFHEEKDVVILAVNLTDTESSKKNVPEFVEDFGLTFRILLDEDLSVSSTYQIQPIPTTYLINSNGIIHNKAFGALNYEMMVQEFEKME